MYQELRKKMEDGVQRQRVALKKSILNFNASDIKTNPQSNMLLRRHLSERKQMRRRMVKKTGTQ